MRIKLWIAAWAILGLVNAASADITYTLSETDTGLTGPIGSTTSVNIYLNENLSGSDTSLIVGQGGMWNIALGITSDGIGNATINTAGTSIAATSTGAVDKLVQIDNPGAAGNNAAFHYYDGQFGQPGFGNSGYTSGSSFLIGTLSITIGSVRTTYTAGSAYAGSNAAIDQAPSTLLIYGDSEGDDIAYAADNAGAPTYTGYMDSGGLTFTVGPSDTGAVPEPSSMLLCGFALSGLGYGAWRRRKAKVAVV